MTTTAKTVKAAGLKTLEQFSQISGVPVGTLKDWHTTRPQTFEVLLLGSLAVVGGAGVFGTWLSLGLVLPLEDVTHVIIETVNGKRYVGAVSGGVVYNTNSGDTIPTSEVARVMPYNVNDGTPYEELAKGA